MPSTEGQPRLAQEVLREDQDVSTPEPAASSTASATEFWEEMLELQAKLLSLSPVQAPLNLLSLGLEDRLQRLSSLTVQNFTGLSHPQLTCLLSVYGAVVCLDIELASKEPRGRHPPALEAACVAGTDLCICALEGEILCFDPSEETPLRGVMLKLLEMPLLDSPLASELAVLLEHLTPCELPLRLGALPGPASGTAKAWIGRTARSHDQAGSIPWDADSLLTALLAFDEAADEAGTDGGSTDLATGASRFTMRMQLVHARGRSLIGRLLVAAVAISKGPGGAAAALPVLEVIQAVCEQAAAPMPPHSDLEGLLEQLVGTAATKGENGQGLGKLLVVFDLLLADRPAENAEMQAALLGQAVSQLLGVLGEGPEGQGQQPAGTWCWGHLGPGLSVLRTPAEAAARKLDAAGLKHLVRAARRWGWSIDRMANMSSLPGSGQNYSSAQVLGAFLRLAMVGLVAVKKEVQPPGCPVQVGNEAAAGDGAMIDASTTALVEEPAADWAVLLHSLTWLLVGWLHGGCLALLRVNADHGMALLAVMKGSWAREVLSHCMPLDHEERDERPEPDDVEAALDSLAAAMITPSALPDEVAAAVVGYILSQAAPGKSTGSPQTLCESDRPLRVAVSLLLGHVKGSRTSQGGQVPSCLALGSRPVSHDVAVLGGAPWAVELFLDLVANAAREAVAGGSLQGSSAGDLEGSRAEGSLMDQATIRLAVLLVIWHTLPARTRAALLAATCQVLEGVVRTLGSLEPHPIRPGSAAEAANARSLLLGLLGYQLANWGQPASPRAVKAVALVTRSKALANPCSSDESLDSVGLRLMVSEWTSLLSSTSHAKSFPGASSVRNAATALSSASPALSLLGQVGSASLVGSSAGTAPVSLAAALAGDVWADAKSAAVSVSPAACVPGDNWKLEAPESLWEWLCRSVDCLSQVSSPIMDASPARRSDCAAPLEHLLSNAHVFLHGWNVLQDCSRPPPLDASHRWLSTAGSISFLHQVLAHSSAARIPCATLASLVQAVSGELSSIAKEPRRDPELLLWEAAHHRRFALFATLHGAHSLVAKQVAAFKLDDDAGQLEDALACSLGLVSQSLAVSSALSITEVAGASAPSALTAVSLLLPLRLSMDEVHGLLEELLGLEGRSIMGVKSVTAICAAAELMPGWQKALLGRFNGGNNIVLQHGLPLTPQSGSASVHSSRLLLCSAMEAITAFLQALPSSALPKITLLDQLARAARWVSMAAPLSPEAHLAASMEQALVAAAGAECLDDLRNRQHWEAIHGAIQALEGAVTMSGMEGAGGRLLVQGAVMSLEALAQDASAAGAMGKLARGEVPGLEALFGALGAGGNAGDTALLQLVVNLIRLHGQEAARAVLEAMCRTEGSMAEFVETHLLRSDVGEGLAELSFGLMQALLAPSGSSTDASVQVMGRLLFVLPKAVKAELLRASTLSGTTWSRLQQLLTMMLVACGSGTAGLLCLLGFMSDLDATSKTCPPWQQGQLLIAFQPVLSLLSAVLGGKTMDLPGQHVSSSDHPGGQRSAGSVEEAETPASGRLSPGHSDLHSDFHEDEADEGAGNEAEAEEGIDDDDEIIEEDMEGVEDEMDEMENEGDGDEDEEDEDEDDEEDGDDDLEDEDNVDDEGDVLMDHPNVTHDFASAASRMRQERRWHAPQPVEDNATSQSRVESTGQNSRNSLVCSYTRSGESFVEQHWYFCYTCGLTESKGCCSCCAAICHSGHELAYSGKSRFFCDCGAGVPRCPPCKCLQPQPIPQRQAPSSGTTTPAPRPSCNSGGAAAQGPGNPSSSKGNNPVDSQALLVPWSWDVAASASAQAGDWSSTHPEIASLVPQLRNALQCDGAARSTLEAAIEAAMPHALSMATALEEHLESEATVASQTASAAVLWPPPELGWESAGVKLLSQTRPIAGCTISGSGKDLLMCAGTAKASTLDAKSRGGSSSGSAYSAAFGSGGEPLANAGREVTEVLTSGMVNGSFLATSSSGLIAVARFGGVVFLDGSVLAEDMVGLCAKAVEINMEREEPGSSSEAPMPLAVVARHSLKFDILSLKFDQSGQHLAVAGLRDIQVWSIEAGGHVKDRLPLKLPLSPHGYNEGGMPDVVVQVSWLPGSSSRLAVASLHCVWLYDLSASASQPAAKIELPQGGPLVSFACAQRIACLDSAAPSGAPELSLAGCPADSQSQVAVKVTVLAVLCQDGSLSATEVPGDDEQLAENMRVTGNGFTTRSLAARQLQLSCGAPPGPGASLNFSDALGLLIATYRRTSETHGALLFISLNVEAHGLVQCYKAVSGTASEGQNLPHIDRAMEVPLLPLTRRALGTSTLVIGLPHRSLGPSSSGLGPSGAVLALRHVDGGLQTVVQPLSLAGNGVGQVESVTSLQVTDLHQTIVVMLDSRGVLHFFSTPLPQPILPVPVALEKGPQSRAKAQMQAMVPAAVQKAAFSRDPFSLLAIQWGRALGSQRQLSRVAGDERNGFCSSSVQAQDAVFPFDFFEDTLLVTADVTMSAEAVDSDAAASETAPALQDNATIKRMLTESGSFVEAPSPAGVRIVVQPPDLNMVVVGIRIHVGATGSRSSPSQVILGQRTIRLKEGGQCRWYDLPMTTAEALAAHPSVSLQIGPATMPGLHPRLDSLEVYAKPHSEINFTGSRQVSRDTMTPQSLGTARPPSSLPLFALPSALLQSTIGLFPGEAALTELLRFLEAGITFRGNHKRAGDMADVLQALCNGVLAPPADLLVEWLPSTGTQSSALAAAMALQGPLPVAGLPLSTITAADASRLESASACILKLLELSTQGRGIPHLLMLSEPALHQFLGCCALVHGVAARRFDSLTRWLSQHWGSGMGAAAPQVRAACALASAAPAAIFVLEQRGLAGGPGKGAVTAVAGAACRALLAYCAAAVEHGVPSETPRAPAVEAACAAPLAELAAKIAAGLLLAPSETLQRASLAELKLLLNLSTPTRRGSRASEPQSEASNSEPCKTTRSHIITRAAFSMALVDQLIDSISAKNWPALRLVPAMQLLHHLCLSGASAPPLTRNSNTGETVPADVSLQSGESHVALHLKWLISDQVMTVVERSCQAALEKMLQLNPRVATVVSALKIELPGPAAIPVVSPPREVPESTAMLLSLLAHCARAHRATDTPSASSPPSPISAQVRMRLASSNKLQSALLALLRALMPSLEDDQPEDVGAGGPCPSSPSNSHGNNSDANVPVAYINGHPAYGTAPGCGQLLQGPGKAWAEANMAAGARDEAAPFLPDEQMGSGPRGAVLEVPAVLAAESVLVLWSSVMHGSSGWMPPRPDAEAWKQVLCAALAAPRLAKQRKHTRRLLLALCGGHSSYRDARSAFLLERRLERLRALAAVHGTSPGDYTAKCDLLSALTAMLEVVDLRPKCWRAMCGSHSDLLPWLIGTCPGWDEAHLVAALKLVRLALPSGSHHQQSQATPGSPHEGSSSGAVAVDVDWLLYGLDDALAMQGADSQIPLASFVTLFLLRPGGCSVRSEAAGVLRAAWRSLGGRAQGRLLAALLSWVPRLQPYGDSAAPYFELLSWMVKGGGSTSEGSSTSGTSPSKAGARASDGTQQLLVAALKLAIPGLSASLLGALRDVNASLADHPHAKAYEALRGLTEFEGYFLEGTEGLADADLASICLPPLVSDPTATGSSGAFTVTRLDTLRAETKYTANSVSYRLSGRYAIKAFSLQVHELRRSRTIAALSVHFCTAPLSELAELKHSPDLWHLALKAKLAPGQTVFKRQLPVPAVATALLIRLEDYHVNLQEASNETIQCPRCSHIVRDRHGVCGYCHENAHQCRQCRNINYECLDGFLCNECGHCRFGRLDFSVTAFTSSDYPPLITDEDVARALVALDREADALHRAQEEHSGLRPPLAAALSSCGHKVGLGGGGNQPADELPSATPVAPAKGVSRGVAMLGILYGVKCRSAYQATTSSVHALASMQRRLHAAQQGAAGGVVLLGLADALPPARWLSSLRPAVFPALEAFVGRLLELLDLLARRFPGVARHIHDSGAVRELFVSNLRSPQQTARSATVQLLVRCVTEGGGAAAEELAELVEKRVLYAVQQHHGMDVAAASLLELGLVARLVEHHQKSDLSSGEKHGHERTLEIMLHLATRLTRQAHLSAPSNPAVAEAVLRPCLTVLATAANLPTVRAQIGAEARRDVLPGDRLSSTHASSESTADLLGLICELLINPANARVRSAASDFLQIHSLSGQDAGQAVLSKLLQLLPVAAACGPWAESFFSLLAVIASQPCNVKTRLSEGGLVSQIVGLLNPLANQLLQAEYGCGISGSASFWHPGWEAACRTANKQTGLAASPVFAINQLVVMLAGALGQPGAADMLVETGMLTDLLLANAALHSLTVGRSKLAADAQAMLGQLLAETFLPSAGVLPEHQSAADKAMKEAMVRSCVQAISRLLGHAGGEAIGSDAPSSPLCPDGPNMASKRVAGWLLESLSDVVCPEKPEPNYLLVLEKAPTQEEFIRGSMNGNPYSSSEIGPLMRDVKNVVCQTLDMAGLLEDDFGMELLVAGRIINLSLPISAVYERIWRANLDAGRRGVGTSGRTAAVSSSNVGGPPMLVTYRLQGLDGEATEPMVSELEEVAGHEADPQEEYAVAAVLAEELTTVQGFAEPSCSIALLLHQLAMLPAQSSATPGCPGLAAHGASSLRQRQLLAKILQVAMHLKPCRSAALHAGGLPRILRIVHAGLLGLVNSGEQRSPRMGNASSKDMIGLSRASIATAEESLLLVLEQLVEEASTDANRWLATDLLAAVGTDGDAGVNRVDMPVLLHQLAECLTGLVEAGYGNLAKILARVMPFLAAHNPNAQEALLDRFATSLDLNSLDKDAQGDDDASSQQQLEFSSFLKLVEELSPKDEEAATGQDQLVSSSPSRGVFLRLVLERGIPGQAVGYLLSVFGEADAESQPATPMPSPGPLPRRAAALGKQPSSSLPPSPSTPMTSPICFPVSPMPGPSAARRRDSRWAATMERPGVPAALRLLTALARGHSVTAQSLVARPELLALLHRLEGCSSENHVGGLAETLLEVLASTGGESTALAVDALRSSTKAEMKERAERKRQEMLADMGMQQVTSASGHTIVSLSPGTELAKAMEELEDDEDELACMVCREGYKVQPTELLGVYCFCKRVPGGPGGGGGGGSSSERPRSGLPPRPSSSSGGGQSCYSTVSHFNLIHISCHAAARRADSALRQPKREWEGATRRNGDTLCNNLLPVASASVPLDAYTAAASIFWDNLAALGGGGGRSGGSRSTRRLLAPEEDACSQVALVAADVGNLLERFATRASFSADSRGGGRDSNARLLPYMLQLGRHAVRRCSAGELQPHLTAIKEFSRSTQTLSDSPLPGAVQPSQASPLEAHAVLAMTLLLQPPGEWMASRRAVLWNVLLATFQRHCCLVASAAGSASTSGGASSAALARRSEVAAREELAASSDAALLEVARPALSAFAVVSHLQAQLKPDASPERWEAAMAARLADLGRCVEIAAEMVELMDELADSSSALEAFDVLGVLKEAMEGGLSAEEFLRRLAS